MHLLTPEGQMRMTEIFVCLCYKRIFAKQREYEGEAAIGRQEFYINPLEPK